MKLREFNLEITGATLLSVEEAAKLPKRIREYNDWWWLRSPGSYNAFAIITHYDGSTNYFGRRIDHNTICVRPALKISELWSSNLKIGDTFEFGGKKFEIINEEIAFCLGDIGKTCFNENTDKGNDYRTSDIKRYVDHWFNESIQKIKEGENMDKDNYLVINGKRIELTEEQIAVLNKKEPEVIKESPFNISSIESYFWIDSLDEIQKINFNQKNYISIANACKDKELMQQRAWRETLSRLLWRASIEANEPDNPWDGDNRHYYIVFRPRANDFIIVDSVEAKRLNDAYFPTEESAKNAIEDIVKPFLKAHPNFKI